MFSSNEGKPKPPLFKVKEKETSVTYSEIEINPAPPKDKPESTSGESGNQPHHPPPLVPKPKLTEEQKQHGKDKPASDGYINVKRTKPLAVSIVRTVVNWEINLKRSLIIKSSYNMQGN